MPPARGTRGRSAAAPSAMSERRRTRAAPWWDAPLTVALLVGGVGNVTVTVARMRILPQTLQAGYEAQGIGEYTSIALATGIGWAVIVISVLALVIAIGVAVPRIRTHRTTFWVPLVAAAVSTVLTVVLVMIAVVGDPAGAAYFHRNGV